MVGDSSESDREADGGVRGKGGGGAMSAEP